MNVGIVPVKALDRAKTRLEASLGAEGRRALAGALLDDALSLCAATPLRWLFVSDDPGVLELAAAQGHDTLRDAGEGLNEALAQALSVAHEMGASSVTVVPSDVPLAARDDVLDIIDTGETSQVVLVPAHDGGTNGLFLRPPGVLSPRFGAASLAAHAAAAEELGLRCTVLPLDRMGLDIDSDGDIDALLAADPSGRTHAGTVLSRFRTRTA